jgi:multidrug efflux pump subunit AcrA (membrane-fusion protein)
MQKKSILTLLLLCLTMTAYGQIYEITEDELAMLETTIERQKNLLEEQAQLLIDLKQEIESLRTQLRKARKSFDEYETGAERIQEALQVEAASLQKRMNNWKIASGFIAAGAVTTGFIIGFFVPR